MNDEDAIQRFIKFMKGYSSELLDVHYYFPQLRPITLEVRNDMEINGFLTQDFVMSGRPNLSETAIYKFRLTDTGIEILSLYRQYQEV